jgi:hypothetical protein
MRNEGQAMLSNLCHRVMKKRGAAVTKREARPHAALRASVGQALSGAVSIAAS